jgi:xanthosine utilization system XapX-like protein
MRKESAIRPRLSYDYYLVVATAAVLAAISVICVYGMFYFKFAELQHMPAAAKNLYMNRMNQAVSPFIIALIMLLGICVPKRLLPVKWLNRFALALLVVIGAVAFSFGVITALQVNLVITLALQCIVLGMALVGNEQLHFEKKGYWVRVGSSCMHLGLILFILDLFFYRHHNLHIVLFWVTTVACVVGMLGCFYSESIVRLVKRLTNHPVSSN